MNFLSELGREDIFVGAVCATGAVCTGAVTTAGGTTVGVGVVTGTGFTILALRAVRKS
jgi:hypothetical protein